MTAAAGRVLRDPLFQLNTVLWLVTESPAGESRPLLREAGYRLQAIAPRLPIPPEVRERLAQLVTGHASPDVLLTHVESSVMLVIECKASSFGPETKEARQGLKLLAGSADLSGALGGRVGGERPGHLVYLLADGHEALVSTLEELRARLDALGVPAAPGSAVGLDRDERGVVLGPVAGDALPAPAAQALGGTVVVSSLDSDTDPRPLYLVPWDPTVEQAAEEEAYCRRQLGARVLNTMVSRVGRMRVPDTQLTRMDELLEEATFGVSRYWRDPRAVDPVHRAAQRAIVSALERSGAQLEFTWGSSPVHVQLTVSSEDDRDEVITALESADKLQVATPPPPTLFDAQEPAE